MIVRRLKEMSRTQRKSLIFGLLLFMPIPGLAIWHGVVNHWAGEKVDEHLAFLESTDIPTNFDELFPAPENSDHEMMSHPAMIAETGRPDHEQLDRINGYAHEHRVDGLAEGGLRRPGFWAGEATDVRNFFDPVRHETEAEAARELRRIFAPERERLENIADAFARPKAGWRAEREYYDGLELLHYPDLFQIRKMVSALQDHAILAMVLGDEASAARLLTAIHHANLHSTRDAPSVIHFLLATVYFDVWTESIREGIRRGCWSDPTLRDFGAMLTNSLNEMDFLGVLSTEMGHHAGLLRQMKAGGSLVITNPFENWVWEIDEIQQRTGRIFASALIPRGFLLKAHVDDAREFFDFAMIREGAPRASFAMDDLEHIRQRRTELESKNPKETDPNLVWILSSLIERDFQHRTSAALLQTGIALERYRLKYGAHPDSLSALVPEFIPSVPLDPYDGQPLRYRRRDDADATPLVWSIGPNGVDESGMPTRNREDGDLMWITTPLASP
ncbi:MAG: hypothetical protein ACNA8L_04450 [Luteolibacter sp.]